MNKTILITASFLGLIGVILGAFGAHVLKELITTDAQQTFETGVRYQMYHALFLLFVGGTNLVRQRIKRIVYYLTVVGVILFSGSIYALATNMLTTFDFRTFGFVTPVGGLLLITSWICLFINFVKMK